MDPARQFAQLGKARLELLLRAIEQSAELGIGVRTVTRCAEEQRKADEAGLRAVVEVALESPARGVARLHESYARCSQLLQTRAQLGVELGHAAAQQPAKERERRQSRRDESGQPGGVAAARERDGHEQKRS